MAYRVETFPEARLVERLVDGPVPGIDHHRGACPVIDGYVLGLDTGVSTGFAVLRGDASIVQSGSWKLGRSGDELGARFVRLHDHLTALRTTWPSIRWVTFEMPGRLEGIEAIRSCWGLAMHVCSWAEREGDLQYSWYAPSQVKDMATGNGNANKIAMCRAARARFGVELYARPVVKAKRVVERDVQDGTVGEEDEADALFVALCGLVDLGFTPELQLQPSGSSKRASSRDPLADFYGDPA
jgi:Holliday junction resolvasome RuvABC endonuclease subunit